MMFLPIFPYLRVIFPYLRVFEILHIFPYLRAFFDFFPDLRVIFPYLRAFFDFSHIYKKYKNTNKLVSVNNKHFDFDSYLRIPDQIDNRTTGALELCSFQPDAA
jgi:hypothetical protein